MVTSRFGDCENVVHIRKPTDAKSDRTKIGERMINVSIIAMESLSDISFYI